MKPPPPPPKKQEKPRSFFSPKKPVKKRRKRSPVMERPKPIEPPIEPFLEFDRKKLTEIKLYMTIEWSRIGQFIKTLNLFSKFNLKLM